MSAEIHQIAEWLIQQGYQSEGRRLGLQAQKLARAGIPQHVPLEIFQAPEIPIEFINPQHTSFVREQIIKAVNGVITDLPDHYKLSFELAKGINTVTGLISDDFELYQLKFPHAEQRLLISPDIRESFDAIPQHLRNSYNRVIAAAHRSGFTKVGDVRNATIEDLTRTYSLSSIGVEFLKTTFQPHPILDLTDNIE